jgi:hypothetical protein
MSLAECPVAENNFQICIEWKLKKKELVKCKIKMIDGAE